GKLFEHLERGSTLLMKKKTDVALELERWAVHDLRLFDSAVDERNAACVGLFRDFVLAVTRSYQHEGLKAQLLTAPVLRIGPWSPSTIDSTVAKLMGKFWSVDPGVNPHQLVRQAIRHTLTLVGWTHVSGNATNNERHAEHDVICKVCNPRPRPTSR
ncbi:MAG: hypothetical protein WCJ30_29430, partial [Deltaproteobacteria bacterium]